MDLEAHSLPICRVCGVYFSRKKCPFCEVTPFDTDYWHEKVSDLPEGALVGTNEVQQPRIAENQQKEMPSVPFQKEPSSLLVPEGEKKAAGISSDQPSTAEKSILEDETPVKDQFFEETSPTQEDNSSLEGLESAPFDVTDDVSHLTEQGDSLVELTLEKSFPEEEVPVEDLEYAPEEDESGPGEDFAPAEFPDEEPSESEPDDALIEMALDYSFPEEDTPVGDLEYHAEDESSLAEKVVPPAELPDEEPSESEQEDAFVENEPELSSPEEEVPVGDLEYLLEEESGPGEEAVPPARLFDEEPLLEPQEDATIDTLPKPLLAEQELLPKEAEIFDALDDPAIIRAIEEELGKEIPLVSKIGWNMFGYMMEGANVVALGLCKQNLITLPNPISYLRHLRVLNLRNNQLVSLPDSFGNLGNLEELYLWQNQLTELPTSFGQLTKLKKVDLKANQLAFLPETFSSLSSLETLLLDNNKLQDLPKTLVKLSKLQILSAASNEFTTIPEHLGELPDLRSVSFKSNRLTTIPKSLEKLQSLVRLSLDHNHLRQFPEFLFNFPAMRYLNVESNPVDFQTAALLNRYAIEFKSKAKILYK